MHNLKDNTNNVQFVIAVVVVIIRSEVGISIFFLGSFLYIPLLRKCLTAITEM